MFGNRVIKELGDDDFKDIEIYPLMATSQVASEFLVALLQKNTVANGFGKFHLNRLKGPETALEDEVFEQLLPMLIHVQDFQVGYMFELASDEVREQLVNFAADVIEQHKS